MTPHQPIIKVPDSRAKPVMPKTDFKLATNSCLWPLNDSQEVAVGAQSSPGIALRADEFDMTVRYAQAVLRQVPATTGTPLMSDFGHSERATKAFQRRPRPR